MTDKMTPETAKELIYNCFCQGCEFSDNGCSDCLWHTVIEALEKQIPKKPNMQIEKMLNEYYDEISYEEKDVYNCPVCGMILAVAWHGNKPIKVNCCINCGQAIDWRSDTK